MFINRTFANLIHLSESVRVLNYLFAQTMIPVIAAHKHVDSCGKNIAEKNLSCGKVSSRNFKFYYMLKQNVNI